MLLVLVVGLFTDLLNVLNLRHLDLDLPRQDLRHVDHLLHYLCLDPRHWLVIVLGVWARNLCDRVHCLYLLHLLRYFLHHGEQHLLLHLLRLDDALPDLLVHMLDLWPWMLRGGLHSHHLRDLHWLLHLQQVGTLHNLLEVPEILLWKGLVNILDDGLRNLPHHLADLDLGHLHDALLVDDVGDLHDPLHVLHLHPGHLLLHVLDLHARDLLHDLPDLHARHLHDVLLHLHHGHLVHTLHKLVHWPLHWLLYLLQVIRPGHLPGDLHDLLLGHLHNLLFVSDLWHLDELLLQLDDWLFHVHHFALSLFLGDLLHQVHDLHVRHLHQDFLVNYVRDLHNGFTRLENLHRHLFDSLLVLVACLLPDHLMRNHSRNLNYLLVCQLDYNWLLAVADSNTRYLHNLLHLLNLMLVLHDRMLLHHLLPRNLLDHLANHRPRHLVHHYRLHRLAFHGQQESGYLKLESR
mmetsp:Transcript_120159/g.351164  ORF Transcript_120159/g.351164 Transcript_120159/m.351164 type:complete len:462 (+) Transcript_120159:1452-2837(+)